MESPNTNDKATKFPTFKRVFCWRNARIVLIGFAGLITLLALFHAEEDWRGGRAWAKYKREAEAKGAVFDLKAVVPPSIPDNQNFAMTPLLKPVLDIYTPEEFATRQLKSRWKDETGYKRAQAISIHDAAPYPPGWTNEPGVNVKREYREHMPDLGKWQVGRRIDLAHWQFYYRSFTNFPRWPEPRTPAEDVLKALSRFDAELAELKEASRRPYSRYNVAYAEANPYGILLPHLSVLRNVTRVACLRATAQMVLDQPEAAVENVLLAMRLSESLDREPFLISHLVRIAALQIALATVWEGLLDQRWSDAQLRQLDAKLAAIDLMAECRLAMRGERAGGNGAIEWLKRNAGALRQLSEVDSYKPNQHPALDYLLRILFPRGWFEFEQVNYNRFFDEFILAALPERTADFEVRYSQQTARDFKSAFPKSNPVKTILDHQLLGQLLLPAVTRVQQKSVAAQAYLHLARVALALERYRLKHSSYPESLAALSPSFLAVVPPDPMIQQPFHYRRTDDGQFLLYSVGWNLQDDGGKLVLRGKKQRDIDWERGDWVWPSPAPVK